MKRNDLNKTNETAYHKESLPYERFLSAGPTALTDAELLAIIIRTGTANMSPVRIGELLLSMCEKYAPGLAGLHHMSLEELMTVPGIGEVKGIKLKCIAELSNRISMSRPGKKVFFHKPEEIAAYYMERLCHSEEEHVILGFLNHQMMLTSDEEISIGSVREAIVSPREVYIRAVKKRAVNIIMLHNHPGGVPEPSVSDIELTQQIYSAGKIMDIRLCDHIIIGDHSYYSFKENHLLE